MTIKEIILKWDNSYRYDFWWRQKHNIAFNSQAHREVTQLDILFEYVEHQLSILEIEKLKRREENKKLIESGQWMIKDKRQEDELFKKVDLSEF